jgi:hypothetical protein
MNSFIFYYKDPFSLHTYFELDLFLLKVFALVFYRTCITLNIYIPLTLNPRRIAEASQIFLRDIHVLPKLLSNEEYCRRDRWQAHCRLIAVYLSGVSAINPVQAQCGLVGANECKCSRDQRLNVPSEARRSLR